MGTGGNLLLKSTCLTLHQAVRSSAGDAGVGVGQAAQDAAGSRERRMWPSG